MNSIKNRILSDHNYESNSFHQNAIYRKIYKRTLQSFQGSNSLQGVYPFPVIWNMTVANFTISSNGTATSNVTSFNYSQSFNLFYILYGNAETELADNFQLQVQYYMLALDPTNSNADTTFLDDINSFIANYTGGFPIVSYGQYMGQINTLTPGFATYPPPSVLTGNGWIVVTWIKLVSKGYVYAVAVNVGAGPEIQTIMINTTNTTTNKTISITKMSTTALLEAAPIPNAIQIKNGLNANDTQADGVASIYLVTNQIGTFNISGLDNYSQYSIFFYSTNEDLSPFALTSQIINLTGVTLALPSNNTYGYKLSIAFINLIISTLYIIYMLF